MTAPARCASTCPVRVTTRGGGTDSADAVGLWVTLLSNRAECWLRRGEPDFARLRVNTGARAAAVDVGSRYGALGADPGHWRPGRCCHHASLRRVPCR